MNWIESHPVFVAIAWPLFSAVITALFKARTPEQYDKLNPRVAAFLKVIGAIGLDVPNLLEAVGQTVTGRKQPAGVYKALRSQAPPPVPASEEITQVEK